MGTVSLTRTRESHARDNVEGRQLSPEQAAAAAMMAEPGSAGALGCQLQRVGVGDHRSPLALLRLLSSLLVASLLLRPGLSEIEREHAGED